VATGQEIRQFSGHTSEIKGVAFSPDGKYVLTGSRDNTARLWRVDAQEVIQIACGLLPRDFTLQERMTYNIADNTPTCPEFSQPPSSTPTTLGS
jgi:WD40 repeat protein